MNTKLTIQEKLKDLRVERHLTLEQLAQESGISKSALGKYESDDFKDISSFGIVTLAKYYGVSTDYLLGLTETKNHPNTDLHDLHLGDEMIDLLKSPNNLRGKAVPYPMHGKGNRKRRKKSALSASYTPE